jgi:hypothetical protein
MFRLIGSSTYKPVSASERPRSTASIITKGEHVQFALLYHNKDIQPCFVSSPSSSRFPVLLTAKHAFLGPRCSKESQLFIGYADRGRTRPITMGAPIIIFLCFSNDGMREIGGESKGRVEERRA